ELLLHERGRLRNLITERAGVGRVPADHFRRILGRGIDRGRTKDGLVLGVEDHNDARGDGFENGSAECLHGNGVVVVDEEVDGSEERSRVLGSIGKHLPVGGKLLPLEELSDDVDPSHDPNLEGRVVRAVYVAQGLGASWELHHMVTRVPADPHRWYGVREVLTPPTREVDDRGVVELREGGAGGFLHQHGAYAWPLGHPQRLDTEHGAGMGGAVFDHVATVGAVGLRGCLVGDDPEVLRLPGDRAGRRKLEHWWVPDDRELDLGRIVDAEVVDPPRIEEVIDRVVKGAV